MHFYSLVLFYNKKIKISWLVLSQGMYVKIQIYSLFLKTGRSGLSDPRKETSWSFLHRSLLPTKTVEPTLAALRLLLLVQSKTHLTLV